MRSRQRGKPIRAGEQLALTHGHTVNGTMSPEYRSWYGMRRRCSNPNTMDYPRYGGRGIRVAPQWVKFETFLADVGPRPGPGYSLDRIDNDGDYEPGNVRWATHSEQRRNSSGSKLDANDVRLIRHWKESGYSQASIARAFNVSPPMVGYIVRGEQWGDVS